MKKIRTHPSITYHPLHHTRVLLQVRLQHFSSTPQTQRKRRPCMYILQHNHKSHLFIYLFIISINRIKKGGFWKTPRGVRAFFEEVGPQLGVKQVTDWYHVSRDDITQVGGSSLFTYWESLTAAVMVAYPEVSWNVDQFSPRRVAINSDTLVTNLQQVEKKLGIIDVQYLLSLSLII